MGKYSDVPSHGEAIVIYTPKRDDEYPRQFYMRVNNKRFVLIFWYFESNMFTVLAKNLPIAAMTWLDLSGCIFLR